MKSVAALILVAVPEQNVFVSAIVLVAAVVLVLNSLGILPRGKTAERLKLDLEVSERENAKLQAKVAMYESQPNLEKHAALLDEMTTSLKKHDEKKMK